MIEAQLLNGRYSVAEAEHLLLELFKVKTGFHIAKMNTAGSTEEDIEHSEKRMQQFEEELRHVTRQLRNGNKKDVVFTANISVELG